MTDAEKLELQVMAHRYLYYVVACPVLSDYEYDLLEREARSECHKASPIHDVGSSLPTSYTPVQVKYANGLLV